VAPFFAPPCMSTRRTWIRHASEGDDLIEQNTERPDVGLDGEHLIIGGFRSRPLHGECHRCLIDTQSKQ